MEKIETEYPELVALKLKQFFPDSFHALEEFDSHLPLFKWKWVRHQLKLHFVCRHRMNVAKFFFEMIHRWLLPGRRLDVASLFSSDFHFSGSQNLFTMAEMSVRIDSSLQQEQIEHNLRVIETEIRLGMVSVYHASRLLETHFSSPGQRSSQIQEKITQLIERNPDHIDYDIFGILQQFLVMSREEFKAHRYAAHLCRMITAGYLFKKSIEKAREKDGSKHHIRLKAAPVLIDLPWGPKEVVGICVSLNLLSNHELFEERHLMQAVHHVIPHVKCVINSFYSHEGNDILFLYLEIEKESGDLFEPQELKRLKQNLSQEIEKAIEVPLKSIFMPRNEEEILRYIVALSGQLRYVKDLPQIILMFDEQRGGELYFTVILVRILFPTSYSIQYLFGQTETLLHYVPDRVKRVGFLRKKYPKEATVFRVGLASSSFLRPDQSLDLFRARQFVFQELEKVIGELRDYTGGMLAKQVELIDETQELLDEKDPQLETFFHELYPVEARSILQPQQVKNWYVLWKQLIEFPEDQYKIERDNQAVYVMGLSPLIPELDLPDFGESQLISVHLDAKYRGYLFITSDLEEQQSFISKFPH